MHRFTHDVLHGQLLGTGRLLNGAFATCKEHGLVSLKYPLLFGCDKFQTTAGVCIHSGRGPNTYRYRFVQTLTVQDQFWYSFVRVGASVHGPGGAIRLFFNTVLVKLSSSSVYGRSKIAIPPPKQGSLVLVCTASPGLTIRLYSPKVLLVSD